MCHNVSPYILFLIIIQLLKFISYYYYTRATSSPCSWWTSTTSAVSLPTSSCISSSISYRWRIWMISTCTSYTFCNWRSWNRRSRSCTSGSWITRSRSWICANCSCTTTTRSGLMTVWRITTSKSLCWILSPVVLRLIVQHSHPWHVFDVSQRRLALGVA